MDVVENAIRNALEKGDAADRAFREKVYRSAFAALDRTLKANSNVTVAAAINRRKMLQARIAEIESGFISAPKTAFEAPVVEMTPAVEKPENSDIDHKEQPVGVPEVAVEQERAEPVMEMPVDLSPVLDMSTGRHPAQPDPWELGVDVRTERSPARESEADYAGEFSPEDSEAPAIAERVVEPRQRARYPAVFTIITLLSAGLIGLWWAYDSGLFRSAAEIDTSVPRPPASTGEEDFDPYEEPIREPARPGSVDAQRDWIKVFTPGDPTKVRAPGDTTAELMEDEAGRFIRIRSGSSGSSVTFDVGQGILEQLAGGRVVFVIAARAEEGHETQISVDCNFGELGDCGRKRYAVGYQQGEFLFEIELPDKRPGASGSIAVNSDIASQGRAVDIFEIKASRAR